MRELQIVGGNDPRDRERGDVPKEKSWAIQFIKRISSLQYLIQDDERVRTAMAEINEPTKTQEFGIEVTDTMWEVVTGTHTTKERETRKPQSMSKNRQAT